MIDFDALVLGPCVDAFGEVVSFQPLAGAPVSIAAVFTEKGHTEKFVDGQSVSEEATTLGCQASQFPGNPPDVNDIFVVRGIAYRASDITPDGHGHIQVQLMLATDSQAGIKPGAPLAPSGAYTA